MISGQKVLCVEGFNNRQHLAHLWTSIPEVGKVYIIRAVILGQSRFKGKGRDWEYTGEIGLLLVGLYNPTCGTGDERGFKADNFRLLEDQPLTEIEQEQFAEALFTS